MSDLRAAARLEEIADQLRRSGLEEVELFVKEGRSRRVEVGPQGRVEVQSSERGWAVRASGHRSSLFAAGTGAPRPGEPWPEADGEPIRLPSAFEAAPWTPSPKLEAPLVVESEAIGLLEGFESELTRQLPASRLVRAVLDDGSSRAEIASSTGVRGVYRSRGAALYLEVAAGSDGRARLAQQLAARTAADFDGAALARRFADRLTLALDGRQARRDRAEMVLAPAAAVAVVDGLLPLLVGAEASSAAKALRDRRGRIASPKLTIVDDGRLAGGLFEAPIDGEGVPTRQVVLIEDGAYRQPLLSWRQAGTGRGIGTGCSRRPTWRDPPRPGPTHLFVRPAGTVAPATLVGSVARGYYLLDALGPGEFDLAGDRFSLPVCGFGLRQGRATEPLAAGRIHGSIRALLRGVQAVARDLVLFPRGGLLGSPTLLVSGVELDEPATSG